MFDIAFAYIANWSPVYAYAYPFITFRDIPLISPPLVIRHDATNEDTFQDIANQVASKNALTLANISHQRQKGTCQWIFQDEKYKSWLFGNFRTLYCIGLRMILLSVLETSQGANMNN